MVTRATLYMRHDRYAKLRLQLSDKIRQKSGEKTNELGRRVSLSLNPRSIKRDYFYLFVIR